MVSWTVFVFAWYLYGSLIQAFFFSPPRYIAKMRIKQNHSLCRFLFRCTSQHDSLVEQPVAVKNIICISQFRSFIIPAFFSRSLITIGSGWHQGQAMCVCPDWVKEKKKNDHQLHVITLLIETHNESDSLISTGNKLNKVLWNDWNLYIRIE